MTVAMTATRRLPCQLRGQRLRLRLAQAMAMDRLLQAAWAMEGQRLRSLLLPARRPASTGVWTPGDMHAKNGGPTRLGALRPFFQGVSRSVGAHHAAGMRMRAARIEIAKGNSHTASGTPSLTASAAAN